MELETINNDFSQEELKQYFYHSLNDNEQQKIRELNVDDMISKITTPTYQIKFIENVGYVFIGEGYLIMANGTEPTHYFLHNLFDTAEETKLQIIKEASKKNE